MNPRKFEKPKDHLFFDFFSVYAKNFIDGKKTLATRNGQAKISLLKISHDDEDSEE